MTKIPQFCINVRKLPNKGEEHKLKADASVLRTLSQVLPVVEVRTFDAVTFCKPWQTGVHVSGTIITTLTQECVVSLEFLERKVEILFDRYFIAPHDRRFSTGNIQDGELVLAPEGDDFPDPLEGDSIDLWKILVEELDLHIDLFPRKGDCAHSDWMPQSDASTQTLRKPLGELRGLLETKKPSSQKSL